MTYLRALDRSRDKAAFRELTKTAVTKSVVQSGSLNAFEMFLQRARGREVLTRVGEAMTMYHIRVLAELRGD